MLSAVGAGGSEAAHANPFNAYPIPYVAPYGAFPVAAWVQLTPAGVAVQVYNPYYYPIVCGGAVQALYWNGMTAWSQFAMAPIPGGTYGYSYLTAIPGNPIVNGWAQAYCRAF